MISFETAYAAILARIERAQSLRGTQAVRLIAVSKTRPASDIRALAACGQKAFGENYVQEALAKQRELADLDLEWHFIGPLQSNKCRLIADHFDWLHSLDREKLVDPLNQQRRNRATPLMVLIEVNIDGAPSKSGCPPEAVSDLAKRIAVAPHLRLRGLMAIPEPHPNLEQRRTGFHRLWEMNEKLRGDYPHIDTLSIGMSDDFELAINEGATMVRIGSALFGPRL